MRDLGETTTTGQVNRFISKTTGKSATPAEG